MKQEGFTVIELLVVIALIGLLASIVLVSFNLPEKRYRATVAKSLAFSQSIQNALGAEAIGWWSFETVEGSKSPDLSGNGRPATVCSDVTQVEGVRLSSGSGTGLGLKFDSLKDRIYVPYSDPFEYRGSDLTISFWANPASSETSGGYMVSKPWNGNGQYNYTITFNGANKTVGLSLSGATGWSTATSQKLSPDAWHYIAVSLVGSTRNVKIYLDAELAKEATHTIAGWTPSFGDANASLTVGDVYPYGCGNQTYQGNPIYTFDGLIDEVRLYNQALTAFEIQQHYVEGLARHQGLAVK